MPPRGERDVLVAVDAIGVNFADTMVRRGEYRRDQSLDFTPGFEVAGRVVDGPPDGPEPGRPWSSSPRRRRVRRSRRRRRCDHVLHGRRGRRAADAAALFTQGVTAWYAVHRYGRVAAGEAVLVHAGAGGLGSGCASSWRPRPGRVRSRPRRREAKLEIARGHGAVAGTLSGGDASRSACASSPADAAPT